MSDIRQTLESELAAALNNYGKRTLRHTPMHAQVDLNIDPDALPGTAVDVQAFYSSIASSFGSSYDMEEIKKQIPDAAHAQGISPEAMLLFSLQHERTVQFRGGVLRLPNLGRHTKIDKMGFGEQQVSAVVSGTTDEAFFLCKLLTLLLWSAAGVERTWDDLQHYVERMGFKTTTLVELPFPLLALLKKPVQEFIRADIDGNLGYGRRMGLRAATPDAMTSESREVQTVTHCRELRLVVTVFNTVTGRAEDCDVNFLIRSRADANKARVNVTTELPYAEHCDLIEKLVSLHD